MRPILTADPAERTYAPTVAAVPWLGRAVVRLMAALVLLGLVGTAGLVAWWARDLPAVDQPLAAERRASVTLLDRGGAPFAQFGDPFGETVRAEDLPAHLIDALLATEDRRFLHHMGLDPVGLARAAWRNLRAGGVVEGGSTITQQTAKLLFLSAERSLRRKVQEAVLALLLERRYAKDEILAIYLNRAYFGAGAFGIDAAARRYFGKPVRQVNRLEAAMLVGLLKAPSRYNPRHDPAAALRRAHQVLDNMVDAGLMTAAAAQAARAETMAAPPAAPSDGGFFADWAMEQVRGLPETWGRDVVVRTTLDAGLQRAAERRLRDLIAAEGTRQHVGQGAVLAMAQDGGVAAMVGGVDHAAGGFNRAVDARRQPGSAFKPFVFLAALEAGLAPETMVMDAPVSIGGWTPENYSGRHRGLISLRTALAESVNTAAARLLDYVGINTVIRTARRLGIDSPLRRDATLALGTSEVTLLELTAAYAGLASGTRNAPHAVVEIRDAATDRVLYRRSPAAASPIVSAPMRAAMHDMLAEVVRSGTGKAAALPGQTVAGKTGTSQDYRDAWFVGYTADLVAGVWLGNDDNTPMAKVTGGGLPARLWRDVMAGTVPAAPAAEEDLYQAIAARLGRDGF